VSGFEPGTSRTQVRNVTNRGGFLGHRFKKSIVGWYQQQYGVSEYNGKFKVVKGIWSSSAATKAHSFFCLAVEVAWFRNTSVVRRTRCKERMRMRKRERFYVFLNKRVFVCVEYTCCCNVCVYVLRVGDFEFSMCV
jgi:hypothetical protein